MFENINIAIADDEQLFREGIRFIIEREANLNVIYEAENGQDLINFLSNSTSLPHIIVTDLNMPKLNGVEATKIIRKTYPTIKIIALSSYASKKFINSMIAVGASSYLLKSTTPKIVIDTINSVHNKGFYYDEKVLKIISNVDNETKKKIKSHKKNNTLSNREIEVLELLCQEYTTKEIADKLFISPRTVEGHRTHLFNKTGSKNIAGLVIYGIQKKIIDIEPNLEFD